MFAEANRANLIDKNRPEPIIAQSRSSTVEVGETVVVAGRLSAVLVRVLSS
jgi:hypothetical protein